MRRWEINTGDKCATEFPVTVFGWFLNLYFLGSFYWVNGLYRMFVAQTPGRPISICVFG